MNRPNGLGKAPLNAALASGGASSSTKSSSSAGSSGGRGKAAQVTMGCRLLLDCMGHYSDIVKQVGAGRAGLRGRCQEVPNTSGGAALKGAWLVARVTLVVWQPGTVAHPPHIAPQPNLIRPCPRPPPGARPLQA